MKERPRAFLLGVITGAALLFAIVVMWPAK